MPNVAFMYARSMPARNLYFVDVSVLVIRPAQSFIYEMNKIPSFKKLEKVIANALQKDSDSYGEA